MIVTAILYINGFTRYNDSTVIVWLIKKINPVNPIVTVRAIRES
ncbi:hypothetical protein TZ97_00203 [Streptococcus parasanguinis]|nr:hypothetical protein TZ97_00203 [Streptococcus parasanguinis]